VDATTAKSSMRGERSKIFGSVAMRPTISSGRPPVAVISRVVVASKRFERRTETSGKPLFPA